MGRAPCCEKVGVKKGRWTAGEDDILFKYVKENGEGSWRSLPKNAGLKRCGKSCRLRWINYLRPDLKKGKISPQEEELIIKLKAKLGNRWSLIAGHLPGRTDNEIKNHWNYHLSRRIDTFWKFAGYDPTVAQPNNIKTTSHLEGTDSTSRRTSTRKKTCSHSNASTSSNMPSTTTDQEDLNNQCGLNFEQDELDSDVLSWLEDIQNFDQDFGTDCNDTREDEIDINVIKTTGVESISSIEQKRDQEVVTAAGGGEEEEDWFLGTLDQDDDDGLRRWVDFFDQGVLESNYLWDSTTRDLNTNCWDHAIGHELMIEWNQ